MKSLIRAARVVAAGIFVSVIIAAASNSNPAQAQSAPDPNTGMPETLEIVPVCPDAATRSAQQTCQPETPTPPACIDGHLHNNLVVTWDSASQVSIHTVNHQPLCADVPVYFSSYTMPDHYDGGPFYANPTAVPQPIFDSAYALLLAGTDGAVTLAIDLPDSCKNIQTDVYYGPEITLVLGPDGHGAQYLTSQIHLKIGECQPEEPTPGVGGGETPQEPQDPETPVEPTEPVEPVTEPTPAPAPEPTPAPSVAPAVLPGTSAAPSQHNTLWLLAIAAGAGLLAHGTVRRKAAAAKA